MAPDAWRLYEAALSDDLLEATEMQTEKSVYGKESNDNNKTDNRERRNEVSNLYLNLNRQQHSMIDVEFCAREIERREWEIERDKMWLRVPDGHDNYCVIYAYEDYY